MCAAHFIHYSVIKSCEKHWQAPLNPSHSQGGMSPYTSLFFYTCFFWKLTSAVNSQDLIIKSSTKLGCEKKADTVYVSWLQSLLYPQCIFPYRLSALVTWWMGYRTQRLSKLPPQHQKDPLTAVKKQQSVEGLCASVWYSSSQWHRVIMMYSWLHNGCEHTSRSSWRRKGGVCQLSEVLTWD